MPVRPLTTWPEVYYQGLAPVFKPSSHFIALNAVSPNVTISKPWKSISSPRADGAPPPRKKKNRANSHMSMKYPFYLFVQVVGLANEYPVIYLSGKHRPGC